MSHPTQLAERALRHALALAAAITTDELSARARDAAADLSALTPEAAPLLALLSAHETACRGRLNLLAELREQASADPLTGLRHHRPLADRLAAPALDGTAVLVVDVDQFKTVNDEQGHLAGDQALVALATALHEVLRTGDELYRVGGDEFVALVDVPAPGAAEAIARRLAAAARQVGHTVSVGVAIATPGEPPAAVLRRADAALYHAKHAGRDAIHVA